MSLSIGQQKALITALLFGVKEVNGNAMQGLRTAKYVDDKWELTEFGHKTALSLLAGLLASQGVRIEGV